MNRSVHKWVYSTHRDQFKRSGYVNVHCIKCGTTMRHEYTDGYLRSWKNWIPSRIHEGIFKDMCEKLESQFTDCEEARLFHICDQIHSS